MSQRTLLEFNHDMAPNPRDGNAVLEWADRDEMRCPDCGGGGEVLRRGDA